MARDPSAKPCRPSRRPIPNQSPARLVFWKDDRRRLQVRAESQQTAIAILHHELARLPWHVAKSPSEFYALGCVLGLKCVGIFDEQVRVEQFVPVFVRIGCG